jgi:hypothetical protein
MHCHLHESSSIMPQRGFLLIIAVVLFIAVDTFAFDIGKLKIDLASYQSDVAAIAKGMEPAELNPLLVMYLSDNQASAASLQEFIGKNQAELPVVKQLELFNKKRLALHDQLVEVITPSSEEFPFLKGENTSWMKNVAPHLVENVYLKNLVIRKKLYELKYFEEDDPKQANMAEGWLNGALPFTRYKDEEAWYRQDGVSKWEASLRVEPLILLENDNHPGVLLAGGLLYNFFPLVSQSPDDSFQAKIDDDLWSKYLKRTGLKLGVGALFNDPNTEFLSGVGLQMRVWSFWGVYSTGHSRFSLAVSLSDWDWVKKLLPFF